MAENQDLLTLPVDEVLARLKTSQSGLSSQEVQSRLATYGPNELAEKPKTLEIYYIKRFMVVIVGCLSMIW